MLVKAKYHILVHEYQAAIAVLESGRNRNGIWSYVLGRIEIKILEAVSFYKLGETKESYHALEEAWAEAAPNSFIQPFIELGKDMRTLCTAALKDKSTKIDRETLNRIRVLSSSYAKRLSFVIQEYWPLEKHGSGGKAEELTGREQTVMKSLSQGLTLEEIAMDLTLSLNTVKSVTQHIYDKLGAANRADAVRIAGDLNLLS
jgi:LuxR family maltose regulon positive regulatory protein